LPFEQGLPIRLFIRLFETPCSIFASSSTSGADNYGCPLTNNSSQVLFDPPIEVSTIEPGSHISPPVAASADPSNAGQASLLLPELVALINQAAQSAVAAERANQAPAVSSQTSQAQVTSTSVNGGVPLSSSPPVEQYSPSSSSGPSSSGRPVSSFVVPSFVSSFAAPVMYTASLAPSMANPVFGTSQNVAVSSVVQPMSKADQLFVVGPGFSPVPAKLVAQIVAGKFIDLNELLSANLQLKQPEPQLLLDGRLVLMTQPKKPRRCIEDIATWLEAFGIVSLIMVSHFPHRWRDLLQYQLLIFRTHRHFSGRKWLSYDQAFREHAAATGLTDWSCMNAQLFNFHAAGSTTRSSSSSGSSDWEPSGSSSSLVECKSWNKGRCTAPQAICRYSHRCTVCSRSHRAVACSSSTSRNKREDGKRHSSSPVAAGSSSSSKSRRS